MKRTKLLAVLMLMVASYAFGQDRFVRGYDFQTATGLISGASLEDLVTQSRIAQYACDSTNIYYLCNPSYFYVATNSGVGFTNYYLNIRPASLDATLFTGGGIPSLSGNNTWSGTNDFTGVFRNLSNDESVVFLGYPKIRLTNTMLTVITYTSGGSFTIITTNSFTNVFDGNIKTYSSTGLQDNSMCRYYLDLGTQYVGYAKIVYRMTNSNIRVEYISIAYSIDPLVASMPAAAFPMDTIGEYPSTYTFWENDYGNQWRTGTICQTFQGRYLCFNVTAGVTGGSSLPYNINEWTVYALPISNCYRNLGGSW